MTWIVANTFQWYLEGKTEIEGNTEEESHEDLGKGEPWPQRHFFPVKVEISSSATASTSTPGVRSHRDGLTIVDVHGKSVGRIQDIPVDRYKNIRLCLANTLFSEGCTACLKGGELSTTDWPLVVKGE